MSILLIGFIVIMQIIDIYTTVKILENGGVELNPLLRKAMNAIEIIPALVISKLLLLATLWLLYPYIGMVGLGAVVVVYIIVVANNLNALRKQNTK